MGDNKSKDKILTIPNILSFVRIAIVPFFLIFYFSNERDSILISVCLLAFSAFTDIVDGFVARTFDMVSTFGKIIDPIADKLTQGVVVIAISIKHTEFIPLMAILVLKEFFMFLGAINLFESGTRPAEAKWWGKLGTVSIYAFFIASLTYDIVGEAFPYMILIVLAVFAAICLIFSFINYIKLFIKIKNGKYDMENEHTKD